MYRPDNGPEFGAMVVPDWLPKVGVKTFFIQPGSPWADGHNESFNGKLWDECLQVALFNNLREVRILIECRRCPDHTFVLYVSWRHAAGT